MPVDLQPPQRQIPLYRVHMPAESGTLIAEVLQSQRIAAGPNVSRFESELRSYVGNPRICATGDISSSLAMSLHMFGVGPGDEVIMSPMVCLSSTCPVRNLFAHIRWCDIDPMTGNLDPEDVVRKITPKTKAVVVYHWAGEPADIGRIQQIARQHKIAVIEDGGEALGAELDGRLIGNHGSDAVVFSFYPNRQITTIEGSAIAFGDEQAFERARWLRRYGIHQPSFRTADGEINPASDIPEAGWNTYMNHVAASLGVEQMQYLPKIVKAPRDNGEFYNDSFADVNGIERLKRSPNAKPAYWVYTLLANRRNDLLKKLKACGVSASKVHLRNDLYSCFGVKSAAMPGVDYFAEHALCLPCGWWVSDEDRQFVAQRVKDFA
jgi:dTDP-4-amino-4,6-dideoxygalactose transaminase